MKIAIMQPYFFPYIGYFQLINAVDEFVVYDNIEYTKRGWINRNRILVDERDSYISLPIKKDSDYLNVQDRLLAESWSSERLKMLNRLRASYRKAPYFSTVLPVIEKCLFLDERNLFLFIMHSLLQVNEYLEIETPLLTSSSIDMNHELKAEKRVLEICKIRKADTYINPIGGVELYSRNDFNREGVELYFLKANNINYRQFGDNFIPFLSIVDVMMFNSKEMIKEYLSSFYTLV